MNTALLETRQGLPESRNKLSEMRTRPESQTSAAENFEKMLP